LRTKAWERDDAVPSPRSSCCLPPSRAWCMSSPWGHRLGERKVREDLGQGKSLSLLPRPNILGPETSGYSGNRNTSHGQCLLIVADTNTDEQWACIW
jgi:hypothetical protein